MGPWDEEEERGDVGRVKTRGDGQTETNEGLSIWEIASNVTTDIPQTLEEANPLPYPVRISNAAVTIRHLPLGCIQNIRVADQ